MSNTLGGINLAQIANRTIEQLRAKLVALSNFSTDFSADVLQAGESVTTRVATRLTGDDVSGGFTASDVTSTAYTIPLTKEIGKAIAFTSGEMAKGQRTIENTFIPAAVEAVSKGVLAEVIKLVINASFSNSHTITAANFDSDDITDIRTALALAEVPLTQSFGLLNPTYFGALAKDPAIKTVSASGDSGALRSRRIGMLGGFDWIDETVFPASGTTADEYLAGFFGSTQGLLMAARMPFTDSAMKEIVEVEDIVIPELGFPVQFQRFYVPTTRKHYFAVATLFGVLAGPGAYIRRVKTQ